VDAYVRGDYTAAFSQWRRLADQGNAFAQYWVVRMLARGEGTQKDAVAAVKYDRMAAEQGDTEAMQSLARGLRGGDKAAARKWEEASKGAPSSKVQKDCAEAATFIRRAAEQGKPVAEKMLANLYFSGRGIPKSEDEAVRWIQRSADHGDSASMLSVGRHYEFGMYGSPKDQTQAAAWIRKAAEKGNSEAQLNLARRYKDGEGVPKDYAQAESWYLKAAKDPAQADFVRYMLGSLYYSIALAYVSGDGIQKNPAEAAKWFRKSLESGYELAAEALAAMYERGDGVPKDYAEAEKLYQKCVEMLRAKAEEDSIGGAQTAYHLAELLDIGPRPPWLRNVPDAVLPKDHEGAVKLYISAAERGYQLAWHTAGGFYERGDSVPTDLVKAYFWYNLSAAYFAASSSGGKYGRSN
jgi:TPR repeat protein